MEVTRPFFNELSGNFFRDGEAEDVFNLRGKDYHGDAGGEPCGDREWNKADERPHAAEPKDDEEEARHQCADQQAGCVVLLQDAHDDDHEGSGGAAYLIFASAEQGDEEPGHNGGDEALGWGESACDGKGHGQRNGYYTDGQSRKKVRQKGLFGISFERGEKSRFEHGCRDGWPAAVVAAAGGVEASPSCTRRRPAETDGRLSSFPSASAGGVTWKGCLPSRRCGGACCRNWEPPGWYAGRRLLSIQIRRARLFHMHLKWRRIVRRSAC